MIPNLLHGMSEIQNYTSLSAGKQVSRWRIRKAIKDGELKTLVSYKLNRRKKYSTKGEVLKFVRKYLIKEPEPVIPEDLRPYLD